MTAPIIKSSWNGSVIVTTWHIDGPIPPGTTLTIALDRSDGFVAKEVHTNPPRDGTQEDDHGSGTYEVTGMLCRKPHRCATSDPPITVVQP